MSFILVEEEGAILAATYLNSTTLSAMNAPMVTSATRHINVECEKKAIKRPEKIKPGKCV